MPQTASSHCVLHFGMPKTGSSAIQTWLLRKCNDPTLLYLNLGTRGSGNIMTGAFFDNPVEASHHRQHRRGLSADAAAEENQSIRDRMAAQLEARNDRRVLFSAELLANTKPEVVQALHAFLGRWCGTFEAVGYVRAPVGFMESVYQQHLKSGRPEFDLQKLYPRYRRRLGIFERLPGVVQVRYWPFEPARFPRNCVVRDFCTRVSILCGDEDIPRVNDSLSLDAIRLLYAYRRFGPGYGIGEDAMRENRNLIECLRSLQGPKLRIEARAASAVLHANRADIRWAEERLGAAFQERLHEGPDCIRDESDLLRFSAQSLAWLAEKTGNRGLGREASPQRVADAVQQLRTTLASGGESVWKRLRRRMRLA